VETTRFLLGVCVSDYFFFFWQAELDYKQMQETSVYRGNISLPKCSNANEGSGTKITISRIDNVFWKVFVCGCVSGWVAGWLGVCVRNEGSGT